MGDHRASAGQALGQPETTGRSTAVLLPMIKIGVPCSLVGRSSRNGDSGRNRMAPTSSPGRVRSRAAAIMAPLEKPMAMGALESLYCLLAASMKSARTVAREVMSASSIDRSVKRWKNANPPSNGMPPWIARKKSVILAPHRPKTGRVHARCLQTHVAARAATWLGLSPE